MTARKSWSAATRGRRSRRWPGMRRARCSLLPTKRVTRACWNCKRSPDPGAAAMKFLTTFQTADFFDTLLSLAVAFVLGTLIGAERQYRQRTAGLRTNVLVAVGAAAF